MTSILLKSLFEQFCELKKNADNAMLQLFDPHSRSFKDFFTTIDSYPESNSIAILYKHTAEVLGFRFTEIRDLRNDAKRDRLLGLTIVGEDSVTSIRAAWNAAWTICLNTLESMPEDQLTKILTIRQRDVTVCEAILIQLAHTAEHVGQIIMLAKHFAEENWKPLTIAKTPRE